MSEDPKLFDAGDYNLFRYCHNDPIDNVDPMGLADERREPWYNHQEQAKELDRLSATEALWNRQMNFSSSFGAISVGQNQQFFQALAKFISSSRPDAGKVSLRDVSRAVVADAREATNITLRSIRHDQYGRLRSIETAFAEYATGSSLRREGPSAGGTDATGRPYAVIPGLTRDHAPLTVSHVHGPESIQAFTGRDIPNARGYNMSGKPFISSLGLTGDRGNVIHVYIPIGPGGQFFHSADGLNFEHGF